MTTSSDDTVPTLQRDVQRLLGRCIVRLQQYERLLKAIVANYDISGPANALETVRAARVTATARKTLGTLVGELLGSCVVSDTDDTPFEDTTDFPEGVAAVRFRMGLSLPEAEYVRMESELKELVTLRNTLVHHFIDQHDLWSVDGCRGAQDALVAAYSRIDQHLEQLRQWLEEMEQCRRHMAEFSKSEEFRDWVVNGIAPDGTVFWPGAGIVRALREAAGELSVGGWAPVEGAGRWIAERFPEQVPGKYGCRSWRQVVHESQIFEIRYLPLNGSPSACYRERALNAQTR
jgi:hypothetical protein